MTKTVLRSAIIFETILPLVRIYLTFQINKQNKQSNLLLKEGELSEYRNVNTGNSH